MASQETGLSGIAERYAAALFELADDEKHLDDVANDLAALKQMLAESDDLRRVVRSPQLSRDVQSRALTAVCEKAGFAPLTVKFVGLVARNRRLFALEPMIRAYLAELARRRGEVTADVTAARQLSDKQMNALTDTLKQSLGTKVSVNLTVDPGLIGGLVVRVGSRMIDSSVRTKLQRLQLAMKGVG